MLHRWWIDDRLWRLAITTSGDDGGGEALSPDEAVERIEEALAIEPPWSINARELEDCARYVRQRASDLAAIPDAHAAVREALTRGLLRASRHRAPSMAAPTGELPIDELMRVPLASDLIEELYEKGIEVVDEVTDDAFGAIEVTALVVDDDPDWIEDESELEPEEADAVEVTGDVRDTPVRDGTVTDAANEAEDAPDEGDAEVELEAEVDDDACDAVEDDATCEEPAEVPCGDAAEPMDHPAAA